MDITTTSQAIKMPILVSAAMLLSTPFLLADEKIPLTEHWSFQAPIRHACPPVENESWASNAVDPFILARVEAAGMRPNPQAAPHHLIRRLSFDLTGLPPSPEEVAAFVQACEEDAAAAIERLVNRLMDSPHFGERWARLWLDVARYAEDQAHIVGKNSSLFYPNAYLYRDWVIDAFNSDLPYDQFIRLQMAADIVDANDTANLAALGFIGLGPKYYRRNDPKVMADEWEDRVDTVSRGFLGLTVSCARCHDHKFDPISTKDYYALAGVFASVEMFNRPLDDANGVETAAKKPEEAMHIIRDRAKPQDLAVHLRGDPANTGDIVPRRFLSLLHRQGDALHFEEGSGRRELAEAIAHRENPLTARVLVNRVWGALFGRPLVTTASNFGTLGADPSHPQLLDDLAVRFMEGGWSIKSLIRELALSSTYRQSSAASDDQLQKDPANRLYSRANRRRLSVEMWRDAIFAAADTLDRRVGGKSFAASDPNGKRRALYARVSRLQLDPMLALFDHPDANMHAPGRYQSTTALQKLFAMNNPLMVTQARHLARRLQQEQPQGDVERIERAYRLLYGRAVTPAEQQLALGFLSADPERGWQQYAQVLLASNELLYLD